MDIGDPSDFPATRRRLPSMRELGAFDADRPTAAPAPPAPERLLRNPANASPTHDASPGSERAAPTAAQLRRAIAKADPGTRRRLIRLYGRRDQQKAGADTDETTRPPLRLDEHTELLCASPPAADGPGRAGRAPRFDSPVSEAVAVDAPRVLFPVYNPAEHGADLRTPRRAAAPVEGHFPPPRQLFTALGHQVRERTQKPERAGAPAAVGASAPASASAAPAPAPASPPAPVPEPALTAALAAAPAPSGSEPDADRQLSLLDPHDELCGRDGVNGLLLSRRDLDEAVEDGLLHREIATLLWKNWSARRPVIHVIDDPAPSPAEPSPAASEIDGATIGAPNDSPAHPTDVRAPIATQPPVELEPSTAVHVAASPPAATPAPAPAAATSAAAHIPPEPPHSVADAQGNAADGTLQAAPVMTTMQRAEVEERRGRAAWLARQIWRIVLAVSVLSTVARVGQWAWPHAQIWLAG